MARSSIVKVIGIGTSKAETEAISKELARQVAALLGRRGGQAGRGKAKARGDSEYYKRLRAKQG